MGRFFSEGVKLPIIKIKSTHPESQGEFVEIEAENFNHDTMEKYDQTAELSGVAKMTADEIRAELDARGVEYLARASKAELVALLEASNSELE